MGGRPSGQHRHSTGVRARTLHPITPSLRGRCTADLPPEGRSIQSALVAARLLCAPADQPLDAALRLFDRAVVPLVGQGFEDEAAEEDVSLCRSS
jgi:hypothetical protein